MEDKYIGKKIGIFNIKEEAGYKTRYGHKLYKGICTICGTEKISRIQTFKDIKFCTHFRCDGRPKVIVDSWDNKRLKSIFSDIKDRCYNSNNGSYKWYGAKGIKICDDWLLNPKLFEVWAFNNGYSDNLTIDRIDCDKDYEPSNCRWVTNEYNAKYKSTTKVINVDGIEFTGREWAKYLKLGTNVINEYIRKYGLENTKEFIRRYKNNKNLKVYRKVTQSYYDLYMNSEQCNIQK